jgi:hypothetical protein
MQEKTICCDRSSHLETFFFFVMPITDVIAALRKRSYAAGHLVRLAIPAAGMD